MPSPGVVQLLLDSGAAVNTSDSVLHETPLMEAAGIGAAVSFRTHMLALLESVLMPGDPELVLTLLRARADALRSSASGQTALDFASSEEVAWIAFAGNESCPAIGQ